MNESLRTPEPWLVVTAAHNEADRLGELVASLAAQQPGRVARWVLVDDGSTDGTAEVAEGLRAPFPVTVIRRSNDGGLAAASELSAFRDGVAAGLHASPHVKRVMKLDADLRLRPDYLAVTAGQPDTVGLVGGVIEGRSELAQRDHVRGGLRAYSLPAWRIVETLPVALGWDVLDQVALRQAGFTVCVLPSAGSWTRRQTGSSVGLLAGRRRLGVVCRWTGYLPPYLALKFLRVALQRPYLVGAFWFAAGYLRAGRGPYPRPLRQAYRREQAARLRDLVANPMRAGRALYGRR